MTQQFTPNADPEPQDAAIPEVLPQQEEFYRAPARFGSIPLEAEPKGWDRREGFLKHYPRIDLPTQIIERVSLGNNEPHEPNRLIWGDNLHVMRQIPSNSVDLIYMGIIYLCTQPALIGPVFLRQASFFLKPPCLLGIGPQNYPRHFLRCSINWLRQLVLDRATPRFLLLRHLLAPMSPYAPRLSALPRCEQRSQGCR